MKKQPSQQEATYGPLQRKTFRGALTRELKKQIPSLGALTADALAGHIEKMVDEYFPPIERLRMDQILWPAIDEADSRSPTKPPATANGSKTLRSNRCCWKPAHSRTSPPCSKKCRPNKSAKKSPCACSRKPSSRAEC